MQRFRGLRARVLDIANNTLRKSLKPTNHMIENLIDCEVAYINTNHPDFIGGNLLKATTEQQTKEEEYHVMPEPKFDEEKTGGGFFSSIFGGKPVEQPKKKVETPVKPDLKFDTLTERDKQQIQLIRT